MNRTTRTPTPFPANRRLQMLAGLYAVVWVVAAIAPFNRQDWFLENMPVFLAVPVLVATYRRFQFSNLSYLFITVFLLLHAIGAHYTYTEMPIGNWLRDRFHLERNHYDRVVHFTFGLLMAGPIRELLQRTAHLRPAWASLLTVHVLMAWSGSYEIVEAVVAQLVSPDLGAAYNGIQGDVWDPQKDMMLALAGSVIAVVVLTGLRAGAQRALSHPPSPEDSRHVAS